MIRAKLNGIEVMVLKFSKSGIECMIQHLRTGKIEIVDTMLLEFL